MRQFITPFLLTASIVASVAPSMALAQEGCPTGADLANGIEFEISGGDREVYTDAGNDSVRVSFTAPDGYESRILLGKGVYLLEFAEIVDGAPDTSSRTAYSHSYTPADMPDPKPGARWVSEVATLEGGTPGTEVHNHKFGPLTELTLGACTFQMIPVTVRYDDEDSTVDHLEFLPDLGVALLVGSDFDDAEGERQEDVYTYLSAKALNAPIRPKAGKKGKKGE